MFIYFNAALAAPPPFPVHRMTAISFKNSQKAPRRPAESSSRNSRNFQRLLFFVSLAIASLIFLSHAWTPPIEYVVNMVGLFSHKNTDPNSIEGRIPVGYWQDDGPGSVENAIDENWDPAEREMVEKYLKLADSSETNNDNKNLPHELQSWRGLSFCRLCEEANGNSCMGDAKYNWPQGYRHYIEKHNVKPPQQFIDHVQQQTKNLNL